MKNTRIKLITAICVMAMMVTGCATPNGSTPLFQGDPCQPGGTQSAFSPQSSFIQQAILSPLANIGGTLLATAAHNYSGKYTGKLNKLLTKLVTPKKKKKKKSNQQAFDQNYQFNDQGGQPEFGMENQVDPYTGLPADSDFEDEGQFPQEFPQEGELGEPGFEDQEQFQTFEEGVPQEDFDPNFPDDIQSRGVPGQGPHAIFPSNPCPHQQTAQQYPSDGQPTPPYGYDPTNPSQGYDPYSQQQGQDPYGQNDPYAQQGYPQDPYGEQGYPNDPYAQQGYPQDPNAQPAYASLGGAAEAPIGLDVVMLKKTIRNGAPVMLPIQDGDVLKDGRGNPKAGDKFRIMFRPHTDGYIYVVAIDGSGWAQGIFPPPTSPLANPVKAGKEYTLPEGNNWFSLDQFKGIETIFFVASQEKRQDLEEILQSSTGRERPATETPQQVTKVAMVPYGVGGAHPSAQGFSLSTGSGPDQTIIPTSYFSKTAGQDLRLTRWFRHE